MGCGVRMAFGPGLGCLCYGWALQPSMLVWGMLRTMGPTRVGNAEGMGGWGVHPVAHPGKHGLLQGGTVAGADCGVSALVCHGPSTMPTTSSSRPAPPSRIC